MSEDLHASSADSALENQEALLPRLEPSPTRTVVKGRDDAIASGKGPDGFEDSPAPRIRVVHNPDNPAPPGALHRTSGSASGPESMPCSRAESHTVDGSAWLPFPLSELDVQCLRAKPAHQAIEKRVGHVLQNGQTDPHVPGENAVSRPAHHRADQVRAACSGSSILTGR